MGTLAKLRHERGYFRHGDAQRINMGADVPATSDIGFDAADQMARVAVELAELVADRCGRLARLSGEAADFVGHDGKTLRRLSTPCRLDRGVDAQQPRLACDRAKLIGDAADGFNDPKKLTKPSLQTRDMVDQPRNLGERLGDRFMPFGNDAGRTPGREAEFLSRHHAFILADGQSLHIGLQL